MKTLISLIIILISFSGLTISEADDDLNGKIFYGKATEITPPDIDRMPRIYEKENLKMVNCFAKHSEIIRMQTVIIHLRLMTEERLLTR